MRRIVMTGKTVDEAVEAACTQLGVSRDDLNVTYQVLEMPVRKLFKSVPAREFADRPRSPEAAPQAPVRTERINDAADFELFGKIEL